MPPIIGATCAFDAKIYKNVDGIFDVSACEEGNKKNFKLFYFCFQLPSLLVENIPNLKLKAQNLKLSLPSHLVYTTSSRSRLLSGNFANISPELTRRSLPPACPDAVWRSLSRAWPNGHGGDFAGIQMVKKMKI